jgi:hypothetical protein
VPLRSQQTNKQTVLEVNFNEVSHVSVLDVTVVVIVDFAIGGLS